MIALDKVTGVSQVMKVSHTTNCNQISIHK